MKHLEFQSDIKGGIPVAAFAGFWQATVAFELSAKLRDMTDKPVWFLPSPLLVLNDTEQSR